MFDPPGFCESCGLSIVGSYQKDGLFSGSLFGNFSSAVFLSSAWIHAYFYP